MDHEPDDDRDLDGLWRAMLDDLGQCIDGSAGLLTVEDRDASTRRFERSWAAFCEESPEIGWLVHRGFAQLCDHMGENRHVEGVRDRAWNELMGVIQIGRDSRPADAPTQTVSELIALGEEALKLQIPDDPSGLASS